MAREDLFHAGLDDRPTDSGTRLLLADWLDERGDRHAIGFRWLANHHKYPYHAHNTWDWWNADSQNPDPIRLPNDLWDRLSPEPANGFPRCKEWSHRRDAEESVCSVLPDFLDEEGR